VAIIRGGINGIALNAFRVVVESFRVVHDQEERARTAGRDNRVADFLTRSDYPTRFSAVMGHNQITDDDQPAEVSTTLFDIAQVAARLGVTIRHVRRLVFEHRIPYVKWGHLLRFDPADIDEWIDQHRTPAA
jgi:excisionase family DNA binding protein